VHNADYADAQRAFERARASHNPNNLIALLHHYPWHVDALLSLSDLYIYTGEGRDEKIRPVTSCSAVRTELL